jgi:hypothetical protein
LYYQNEVSRAIDKNWFTYFSGAIAMSKHILGSLKFSGGILSIYCLSLAIVPTAYADTNCSNCTGGNVSQASGFQSASFNSFAPSSASVAGGSGGSGGTASNGEAGGNGEIAAGGKSNPIFGTNRQANIRNAQALQARLDAAQSAYDSASARVAQLLAASTTPPAPDSPKLSTVRFARAATAPGECGCNNPDVATTKPADNTAGELAAKELAAAKAAQAEAQIELDAAKTQAIQYLASAKRASEVSAQNTPYSPVW